jgi:hypothetical protein
VRRGCRSEVVDLIRLNLLDDARQARRVGHVSVVQDEAPISLVRVLIQMIDAVGIEQGTAPLDTMHFITFGKEEVGEVRAILTRHAGDQRGFRRREIIARCHVCSMYVGLTTERVPQHDDQRSQQR